MQPHESLLIKANAYWVARRGKWREVQLMQVDEYLALEGRWVATRGISLAGLIASPLFAALLLVPGLAPAVEQLTLLVAAVIFAGAVVAVVVSLITYNRLRSHVALMEPNSRFRWNRATYLGRRYFVLDDNNPSTN